jgi:ATP-binding cassette subfamily B protein RaxB
VTKKVPLILQSEAAECGLACAAMIARTHGHQIDLLHLRQRFELSARGATLQNVMDILHGLGLRTRPLRAELEYLPQLKLPCILHWGLMHFVVLVAIRGDRATIHDPALGRRTLSLDQVSRHFSGVALEAAPSLEFSRITNQVRVPLRRLLGPVEGLRRPMMATIATAIGLEAILLASPMFLRLVIDEVIVPGTSQMLLTLFWGFALLTLMQGAFSMLRSWSLLTIGSLVNIQWHANMLEHVLRLPVGFFSKRQFGDVVSRFQGITQIQKTLTTGFVEIILDGAMSTIVMGMLFLIIPKLAIISVAALLLTMGIRCISFSRFSEASESLAIAQASQQGHFLETIQSFQPLKLFGREGVRASQWLNLMQDSANEQIRVESITIINRTLGVLIFGMERLVVILLAATMSLKGDATIGLLLAYLAYRDQFASRILNVIDRGFEMRGISVLLTRLGDLVLAKPEPLSRTTKLSSDASVEVRNLNFRYSPNDSMVVNNVSLRVSSGEFVAIAGPSGCGKSTLLKLILGLYEAESGEIFVRGQSASDLAPVDRRRGIAAVMQDDHLFNASILENIALFDSAVDLDFAQECARLACVDADINLLPMKYHTLVGDFGTSFSGGQRQRILIARALYSRPTILLMDEATSHLDPRTEQKVNHNLRQLSITRIVVAHRHETLNSADRIIYIGDNADACHSLTGKLVDVGPMLANGRK